MIVDGELIIGSYLIEAVVANRKQVTMTELMNFDYKVSKKIRPLGYFSQFSTSAISKFQEDYPFFVPEIHGEALTIIDFEKNKAQTVQRLIRHFRIGVPVVLVNIFIAVAKEVNPAYMYLSKEAEEKIAYAKKLETIFENYIETTKELNNCCCLINCYQELNNVPKTMQLTEKISCGTDLYGIKGREFPKTINFVLLREVYEKALVDIGMTHDEFHLSFIGDEFQDQTVKMCKNLKKPLPKYLEEKIQSELNQMNESDRLELILYLDYGRPDYLENTEQPYKEELRDRIIKEYEKK